jgi:hypothetical protein
MLCMVWGFHGNVYEECHLLGYKNPVRTSQGAHYLSVTEFSLLILCKIWGFHALTMKNILFWDVTLVDSCKNQRFGGTYRPHHQGDNNRWSRNDVSGNSQPKHTAKKYYVWHAYTYTKTNSVALSPRANYTDWATAAYTYTYMVIYIVFLRSFLQLLVTANVPSLPILVALMMTVILSSETLVLKKATLRNFPEDKTFFIFVINVSILSHWISRLRPFQRTIHHYIPTVRHLHNHCCLNLKFYGETQDRGGTNGRVYDLMKSL